ncbi:MAG: hypothetical protein ACYTKD_29010 [Planctomycetota bacterium]
MRWWQTTVAAAVLGALAAGCEVKGPAKKTKVKRYASVIGLRDEKLDYESTYQVTIADGAQDPAGKPLVPSEGAPAGAAYAFTFLTREWSIGAGGGVGDETGSAGALTVGVEVTSPLGWPHEPYINAEELEAGVNIKVTVTDAPADGSGGYEFTLSGMEPVDTPDTPVAHTFTNVPLPVEGLYVFVATVVDTVHGNTGGATIILIRDTIAPEISLTTPYQSRSGHQHHSFLYLGKKSIELVTPRTPERDIP